MNILFCLYILERLVSTSNVNIFWMCFIAQLTAGNVSLKSVVSTEMIYKSPSLYRNGLIELKEWTGVIL